ncbi:MAG TPA: hypothetical protein VN969_26800 [Streptosporangiaceae bacterium]|nr:hypothetical protein [Streptosporangiaceae bacterium]
MLLPRTGLTLTAAGATQAAFVALVVVAIAAIILVVSLFRPAVHAAGPRRLGGGEQLAPPATAPRG